MADTVQLRVQLNGGSQVLSELMGIDQALNRIKASKNVSIKIDTNSITRAANQSGKLAENLDRINQGGAAMGGKDGAGGAIDDLGKKADKAAKSSNILANGVKNIFKMAAWQLSGKAVSAVFQAFSDGLATMKEVDSQLVSIRKVTDLTNSEIEQLTDTAYSLASAYGRTADEVLNASVTFARAGYGDQIEQLSELSLLLQNVGDLQADQASEFLIATDKAYKLNRSYSDLMTVIDGLNEITNRNATDMQKMTEGMTVAGSVFAESGESIETFAALLGTATANTQRSGSEMARGLRTILMNIRQIRGETEDGELIDGESIANASKALKDYANISTMENGQLRKASDVLRELAGRWDELDSVQQSAIAEAVAGKRQANVLTTLMGDWETVEKMISDYVNGAGSAMEENAIYLESWEAKSAQLKATWTEFMSDLVDTDLVKNMIGGAGDVLSWIDENVLKDPTERAANATKEYNTELEKVQAEREALLAQGEQLSMQDRRHLAYLTQQERILQEQAQASRHNEYLQWQEQSGSLARANQGGFWESAVWQDEQNLTDFQSTLSSINQQFNDGALTADQYWAAIGNVVAETGDYVETAKEFQTEGENITQNQERQIAGWEALADAIAAGGSEYDAYAAVVQAQALANGATQEEAIQAAIDAVESLPKDTELPITADNSEAIAAAQEAEAALMGVARSYTATITANFSGVPAFNFFAGGTNSAPGGPALVNENGPELIAADGLAWIAGGGKPTVTMLPRGAQVYTAAETRGLVQSSRQNAMFPAYEGGTKQQTVDRLKWQLENGVYGNSNYNGAYQSMRQVVESLNAGKTKNGESSSGDWTDWGGGGGGPTPPNFEELEKALKETLKNLDLQAELAENQEDFQRAMEIYGQAQGEINNLLEQYRANGYAEDSDEILTLANKGYDYAGKQLKDYDTLRDRLIDALNDLTKATEDANDLAERQEAVDKARESLANAERQRTVRVFNPVTGQWEWVANAGDIQRAQENLKSAEDALRKEQIDQTISALENADKSSFEDVPIAEALWSLMNGAPGDVQSALLGKWGAAIGGSSHMASAEAITPFNQGNTSIGTQYNFGNISLTEEQAANMTVKQLADELRVLNIL